MDKSGTVAGSPASETIEVVEPEVDQFIASLKFFAENDLWDRLQANLAAAGITRVPISTAVIVAVQKFTVDTINEGSALTPASEARAGELVARCGCNATTGATVHTAGVGDAGTGPDSGQTQ